LQITSSDAATCEQIKEALTELTLIELAIWLGARFTETQTAEKGMLG
jgi:hypothetical protein